MTCEGIFDLKKLKEELNDLKKQTEEQDFWDDRKGVQAHMEEIRKHERWVKPVEEIEQMVEDAGVLIELMEEEGGELSFDELDVELEKIEKELDKLRFARMLNGEDDSKNAILTIHPGAGGTESADWAMMLMRMYTRWFERSGFSTDVLDFQPGDEAGLKSVTIEVKGDFAYGYLRAESGVHRLVRISTFDANHRRHTSFASVFIYPEVDSDIQIDIRDDELRIDTYRASGAGGQHVNKTDSAVRITHIPTGIVVSCQSERSQHKNKASATKILHARLYQLKKEEEEKKRAEIDKAKKKIEWGSQIRSYVFHPYNMVKDHRTDVETSNIQNVMDGDIDQFIESYLTRFGS